MTTPRGDFTENNNILIVFTTSDAVYNCTDGDDDYPNKGESKHLTSIEQTDEIYT